MPSELTNIIGIATGADHDLALRSNGSVVAWGYDTNAPYIRVPSNLPPVKAVAAGWDHSVALLTNGTIAAWGYNYATYGWNLTNPPAGLSNVVAIAAGGWHTLALRADGTVVAWGAGNGTNLSGDFCGSERGQSIVPAGLSNVVAIAAGGYSSAALRNDGTVLAWGEFDDVPWGLDGVVAIGAGENHGLAVRTGRQTPLIITQPTNQCGSAGGTVSFHVAVIARASIRYQWQRNGVDLVGATNATLTITNLQLGDAGEYRVVVSNGAGATTSVVAVLEAPAPVILSRSVPEAITLTYSNSVTLGVQAGVVGSCAPGLTYQWHFNGQPIAWQTRTNYSLVAASAIRPQLSGVVPIAIAQDGVYSVTVSNAGWSTNVSWTIHVAGEGAGVWWGESASGGWAYSTNIGDIIALDAGEYHGAAVREDGTVIQWGYEWADLPADLTNAIAVSVGYEHTLALRSDGTLVAWGRNPAMGTACRQT